MTSCADGWIIDSLIIFFFPNLTSYQRLFSLPLLFCVTCCVHSTRRIFCGCFRQPLGTYFWFHIVDMSRTHITHTIIPLFPFSYCTSRVDSILDVTTTTLARVTSNRPVDAIWVTAQNIKLSAYCSMTFLVWGFASFLTLIGPEHSPHL